MDTTPELHKVSARYLRQRHDGREPPRIPLTRENTKNVTQGAFMLLMKRIAEKTTDKLDMDFERDRNAALIKMREEEEMKRKDIASRLPPPPTHKVTIKKKGGKGKQNTHRKSRKSRRRGGMDEEPVRKIAKVTPLASQYADVTPVDEQGKRLRISSDISELHTPKPVFTPPSSPKRKSTSHEEPSPLHKKSSKRKLKTDDGLPRPWKGGKKYTITRYTRKQAKKYGVKVKLSTNPKKKIDVFKKGKKIASVGATGYGDFPTFQKTEGMKSAKRHRKNYKRRHEKDRHVKGSPGFYADKLLW